MKEKTPFTPPEIEVIEFDAADIITTSYCLNETECSGVSG